MNWIKVEDRLPEDEERVLICCEYDDGLFPKFAERINNKWNDDMGFDLENVTHWMYIELPKE